MKSQDHGKAQSVQKLFVSLSFDEKIVDKVFAQIFDNNIFDSLLYFTSTTGPL